MYAKGGQIGDAVHLGVIERPDLRYLTKFTLIEQDDGSYAIQTTSGNYVTAVAGGGIPGLDKFTGMDADVFHADATRVQSWEKFRILDQGDGTYAIQTVSGNYIGATSIPGSTRPALRRACEQRGD